MHTRLVILFSLFFIIGRSQNGIPFSRQLALADSLNYFNTTITQSRSLMRFYDLSVNSEISPLNNLDLVEFSYLKGNTNSYGDLYFISSNHEVLNFHNQISFQIDLHDYMLNSEYSFGNEIWQPLSGNTISYFPNLSDTSMQFFIRGLINNELWQLGIQIPITRVAELTPDPSPWPMVDGDFPYEIATYYENEMVYGHAYVKLGEDGIFDKPFLFVEGIDFGSDRLPLRNGTFGWNELVSGNEDGTYGMLSLMPIFLDSISAKGYDLVLLDFLDGAADIRKNAALLKHLIQLCNQTKMGLNENIIAGASMGGIVSRVALREMELNGDCHQCSHYICLDSPHLGANIPLSLQATIYFLSNFIPEAEFFVTEKLERDAAKQLLCYHWGSSNPLEPSWFLNFQNFLANLGLPENTINIAISNGSAEGLPQYTSVNNPLLNEHCNATNWMSGEEIVFKLFPLPGNAEYSEATAYSNVLADLRFTEMSWDNWLSPIDVHTSRPSISIEAEDLDYSNGGWSSSVFELVKVFNASSDFTDACGEINADQYAFKHCFVPLSSSLLQGTLVSNQTANPLLSPFHFCLSAGEMNEPHSYLSWNHIDFLLENISTVNSTQMENELNNAQEVSLVGSFEVLRPMSVNSGKLLVADSTWNEVGDEIRVQLKPICSNTDFEFNGNMEWRIGIDEGNVFSTVEATDSSLIRLSEHQITTVEKQGSLILEQGAALVLNGGTLKIKGRVVIAAGSELVLQGGQLILDGGTIELAGGAIHVLDDFNIDQTDQGGFVWCRSGDHADLIFESGSSLHWNGNPALDSMLVVAEGCVLNDTGDGGWMEYNSAHVVLSDASHVVSFRKNVFVNSWLEGVSNSNYTVQWADLSFFQSRVFQTHVQNDYANFVFRNSIAELNNFDVHYGSYRIEASTFLSSTVSSKHLKSRSRILQSCFYDSNQAVVDQSMTELYVYQSNFSNHETCIQKKGGRLRLRCNLFQQSSRGVVAEKGCVIYLGLNEASGFNTFMNLADAICLDYALVPLFFDGENKFEGCMNYVVGSVTNATCMTQLHFGRSYFELEPFSRISVLSTTSSALNAPCFLGYTQSENIAGVCPAGEGQIAFGKSNKLKNKNLVVTVNGLSCDLDSVFSDVSNLYFNSDSIHQGKLCMQILSDALLQVSTDSLPTEYLPKIHSAMHFMSWLFDELVQRSEIVLINNENEFEPVVQRYFSVLNHFSAESYDLESFHHQFYWELEKIRALRTLGLTNQALFMLINLNQCNLESVELSILDEWLQLTLLENTQIFSDSIETSPLEFQLLTDTEVVFGSQVHSPTQIFIYPCVHANKSQLNEDIIGCDIELNALGQIIGNAKMANGIYIQNTETGEVKKYLRMQQ